MIPAEREEQLDQLLRRYREATEPGETGVNLMPQVWARIEARRANTLVIERVGRLFVGGAVVLALVSGVFSALEPQRPLEDTWVEAIASHQLAENSMYYGPVRLTPISARIDAGSAGQAESER